MPLNYAIPVFPTAASPSLPFPWHRRRLLGRLLFLPEEHSTNAGTSKIEHDLIKAIAGEIWSAPTAPMTHNASVYGIVNHMSKTDGLVFISPSSAFLPSPHKCIYLFTYFSVKLDKPQARASAVQTSSSYFSITLFYVSFKSITWFQKRCE